MTATLIDIPDAGVSVTATCGDCHAELATTRGSVSWACNNEQCETEMIPMWEDARFVDPSGVEWIFTDDGDWCAVACQHAGPSDDPTGHNDVGVECDKPWVLYELGARVGWALNDGGQDDGVYTVTSVQGIDLILTNQHGQTFHAKAHHCWKDDE